jgi:hypothetical protein
MTELATIEGAPMIEVMLFLRAVVGRTVVAWEM